MLQFKCIVFSILKTHVLNPNGITSLRLCDDLFYNPLFTYGDALQHSALIFFWAICTIYGTSSSLAIHLHPTLTPKSRSKSVFRAGEGNGVTDSACPAPCLKKTNTKETCQVVLTTSTRAIHRSPLIMAVAPLCNCAEQRQKEFSIEGY